MIKFFFLHKIMNFFFGSKAGISRLFSPLTILFIVSVFYAEDVYQPRFSKPIVKVKKYVKTYFKQGQGAFVSTKERY